MSHLPGPWWPDWMILLLKDYRDVFVVEDVMSVTGIRFSPNAHRAMKHMVERGLFSREVFRGPGNHRHVRYRKVYRLERIREGPVLPGTTGRTDPPIP